MATNAGVDRGRRLLGGLEADRQATTSWNVPSRLLSPSARSVQHYRQSGNIRQRILLPKHLSQTSTQRPPPKWLNSQYLPPRAPGHIPQCASLCLHPPTATIPTSPLRLPTLIVRPTHAALTPRSKMTMPAIYGRVRIPSAIKSGWSNGMTPEVAVSAGSARCCEFPTRRSVRGRANRIQGWWLNYTLPLDPNLIHNQRLQDLPKGLLRILGQRACMSLWASRTSRLSCLGSSSREAAHITPRPCAVGWGTNDPHDLVSTPFECFVCLHCLLSLASHACRLYFTCGP